MERKDFLSRRAISQVADPPPRNTTAELPAEPAPSATTPGEAHAGDTPTISEPPAPSEAEKKRLKRRGQGGLERTVSVFDLVKATAANSQEARRYFLKS